MRVHLKFLAVARQRQEDQELTILLAAWGALCESSLYDTVPPHLVGNSLQIHRACLDLSMK